VTDKPKTSIMLMKTTTLPTPETQVRIQQLKLGVDYRLPNVFVRTSLTNCGISNPDFAASDFNFSYCQTSAPCQMRSTRRIGRRATWLYLSGYFRWRKIGRVAPEGLVRQMAHVQLERAAVGDVGIEREQLPFHENPLKN
jgi:hypothetical protein